MKRFLSRMLILCMLLVITFSPGSVFSAVSDTSGAAGIQISHPNGTAIPDHVTLTWTSDPMTTQTITWRTDTTVGIGIVQYAKESEKASFPEKSLTVKGSVEKLSSYDVDMNIHMAVITGLEPGVKYLYRVGDGSNWSGINSFSTQPKDITSFKFFIIGDTQSGDADNFDYRPFKVNIQNAYKANPDVKFMINVGDLVDNGQYYRHWNNWFDAGKGIIDNIPAMASLGNHEFNIPPVNGVWREPEFFKSQFKLPRNGPEDLKGEAYSYDYGNVHIVVLNSLDKQAIAYRKSILESQKVWLENDLKNTKKPWKLVFFHSPPYYNKLLRSNDDVKAAFTPIIEKYHVDVVFNAHDHVVARTYPIKDDRFVSSPSKGTVYYKVGRSGNKHYTDVYQRVWDQFYYDPQDQPNYIVSEVNGNKLTLSVFKQDGTPIDSYTIDKDADTDFPKTILPSKFQDTRVVVNGLMLRQPEFSIFPFERDGKWYIPLRAFLQFLGGSVTWNGDGNITLESGKTKIVVAAGSVDAKLNGKDIKLSSEILIESNSSMIAADDMKALLGYTYYYDGSTNMLMFTK